MQQPWAGGAAVTAAAVIAAQGRSVAAAVEGRGGAAAETAGRKGRPASASRRHRPRAAQPTSDSQVNNQGGHSVLYLL